MKNISQAEARRLRRRVEELESTDRARRRAWAKDYPGGINIAHTNHGSRLEFLPAVIRNSRMLGHAVVCTCDDSGTVLYYALPLASQAA